MGVEDLEVEYRRLIPGADRFREALCSFLGELLAANDLPLAFPIQSRLKDWTSIAQKVERLPLKLASITDLHDLIGVRLIFHFQRHSKATSRLIQERFHVLKQRGGLSSFDPDTFGYASNHFVVASAANALATATFAPFSAFRAEIQVRTTAQHIWAAVSHELQYKREDSVPVGIRRAIHRASALLETVDLEFERVLAEREVYREKLGEHAMAGPLNVDSLESLLDTWLPPLNKVHGAEQYDELLEDLEHFRVTTPEDLRRLLDEHLRRALEQDREIAQQHREIVARGLRPDLRARSNAGVAWSHAGLVRSVLELEFGVEWRDYIQRRSRERGY